MSAQPYNAFRKPPEWDELVGVAQENWIENIPITQQRRAANQVIGRVAMLNDEIFDVNRYYGLSLATCALMRKLTGSSEVDKEFQDNAHRSVFNHHMLQVYLHGLNPRQGLYVRSIGFNPVREILDGNFAQREYHDLGRSQRLVSNVLSYPLVRSPATAKKVNQALTLDWALNATTRSVLNGAIGITRLALSSIDEQKNGPESGARTKLGSLLADIASADDIENMDLLSIAAQSASLRIDEFISKLDEFVFLENDEFSFDYAKKKEGPPDKHYPIGVSEPIRHLGRIGCPALYVQGSIPFAVDRMLKIVAKTQRSILEKYPEGV